MFYLVDQVTPKGGGEVGGVRAGVKVRSAFFLVHRFICFLFSGLMLIVLISDRMVFILVKFSNPVLFLCNV